MHSEEIRLFLSKTFPFWNKLNDNEKTLMASNTALTVYGKGENIHSGTNDCIGVLIVKSGSLRTYILSEDGKEVTLYRLGVGDVCVLSASCIIKTITFDVHIDAESESEILLINSAVFKELCNQNIYVENFSYKVITERFSDVMWAMEQILFMSFDKRLAIFLLDEMSKQNTNTVTLTHEQIAKYLGSAREVVTRMLKYFSNENIVELSRGEIKIIDKKKLKDLVK